MYTGTCAWQKLLLFKSKEFRMPWFEKIPQILSPMGVINALLGKYERGKYILYIHVYIYILLLLYILFF
jgi:dolichol kinase